MPELPEVEIIKRSLFKMINKAKIINIRINNHNLRYKIPKTFNRQLKNKKILKISRRSKYLIFHFREAILLIHLGMTGKLLVQKITNNKLFKTSFYYNLNIISKHNHIYFILNNGLMLIYNDVRRFGFLKLYNHTKLNKINHIQKLGLEPLNRRFNLIYFKQFIKGRKKNIKNLLMDQTFVSGLGNIYVNEVLFMSKVNPSRFCNNLSNIEIKCLVKNIKKILRHSILKGGSSIRDFKNTHGKSGSFQQFFYVYGKKNVKCSRYSCKGMIKKIFISSRSSFYCNYCQI
jgi:formamidopyrimidine-DNA glycosylase